MTQDIYFPVRKVHVSEIQSGDFEHPSGINHAIVITKPDGSERVVQYCSESYRLVPNSEIITQFEEQFSKHYRVEVETKVNRWARFFVDFILKEHGINIGSVTKDEDPVFPRITLMNSYDGSIRYSFKAGFYRQVCTNGMVAPVGETKEIKSMHTPNIEELLKFDTVFEMTSEFLGIVEEVSENYFELNEQPVDDWMMRIEEVTEETGFPPSLQEDVAARMQLELDHGLKPTDWLVYNAFNYQLNHNEGLKAKQNKRDSVDFKVLDYLLRY